MSLAVGSLFDAGAYTAHTRHSDPETSHAAAARVTPRRGVTARAVLDAHAAHPLGLTDDEMVSVLAELHPNVLGASAKTCRSAMTRSDQPTFRDTGQRRATTRGCDAIVWTLRDA